jgi:TPR repeat protein
LRSELNQIKSEKAKAIEATNQANAEAKQEQLESIGDKPSELNTGIVSFREDAFNVARYGGDAITETGDYTNDSDRFHAAINSLEKKELSIARQLFLNLANKGMAEAQINLGMMFESGQGVPQDFKEAIRWYRLAADQRHIKAQGKLNSLLKKSAKAQINFGLGMRFESGEGVPQDFGEAIRRYQLAADLGLIKAQEKLSLLLNKKEKILRENTGSSEKLKSIKEKNSREINDLQIATASLRSELNQIKSEKTKAIEATTQINAKAKKEKLASISDNSSELNAKNLSFREDTFDIASHSLDTMTEAGDSINDKFDSFGSECSQLKNKDQQSECFEPFFAATAKNRIKEHSSLKTNSTPNLTKKSQTSKSRNSSEVVTSKGLVSKHLDKWASAWEKQNIEVYLSFYSKEFKGSKESHADWRISRKVALKKHANISIQLQNIQIYQSKETVDINFIQTFKSDGFSDIGTKELVWAKNGSGWRIIKETWVPHKKTT